MSLLTDIDGEFGAMRTGVGRAVELTAAAANAADLIVRRAAGSGFAGIAVGVSRVREAITRLRGQIADVGRAVNEAGAAVGRAPEQLSPQDTIRVLGPVLEQLGAIQGAVAAAVAELGTIHALAAGALQGGRPEEMLQRLDAVKQVLQMVGQRGDTAKRYVETALAQATLVGAAGNR